MCKDKWNKINSNYKKFFYYHKGNRHHASFWELTANELDMYHYLDPSIKNIMMQSKHFRGGVHVNTPMHMKNLQIEGDVNHKTTILVFKIDMQEEQGFVQQHSFTQELFNNDYVLGKYNYD